MRAAIRPAAMPMALLALCAGGCHAPTGDSAWRYEASQAAADPGGPKMADDGRPGMSSEIGECLVMNTREIDAVIIHASPPTGDCRQVSARNARVFQRPRSTCS